MGPLSDLPNSLAGRVLIGSAAEAVCGAVDGLWKMQNIPERLSDGLRILQLALECFGLFLAQKLISKYVYSNKVYY